MAWYDYLPPVATYHAAKSFLTAPSAPGGAGPAQSGQNVVYDPTTGLYVNQTTGAVSQDPAGQQVVQDPTLATQAARNVAISNGLLNKLGQYGAQYTGAFNGQTALTKQLQGTIDGTAPSVAGTQLQEGLDQIRATQDSEAAGATGQNAALARANAMQNIGAAQVQTNQQKALLRAAEVNEAEQTQAGVLSSQAGEAEGMYGTGLSGALSASGQAGSAEAARENANLQGQMAEKNLESNLIQAGGSAIAGGATGGAGKGAVTSDRREKKNVKKVDDDAIAKFIDKIGSYGFEYRHPGAEGEAPGSRVSPMAQNIEKGGPIGKSVVIDGAVKKLDVGNTLGAALGAIHYLKSRLDKIERKAA